MNTSEIALFPLQLLLLPGEKVDIHIFEPRYKQLITECIEENKTFGIPAIIKSKLSSWGTEVEITKVHKHYENNEYDIEITGKNLFYLIDFNEKKTAKLYGNGNVQYFPNDIFSNVPKQFLELLVQANRNVFKPLSDAVKAYPFLASLQLLNYNPEKRVEEIKKFVKNQSTKQIEKELVMLVNISKQEKQLNYRFFLN